MLLLLYFKEETIKIRQIEIFLSDKEFICFYTFEFELLILKEEFMKYIFKCFRVDLVLAGLYTI